MEIPNCSSSSSSSGLTVRSEITTETERLNIDDTMRIMRELEEQHAAQIELRNKEAAIVQELADKERLEPSLFEKIAEGDTDDMDVCHTMLVMKKMVDFCDNLCECDDPINGDPCEFCYYLAHHKHKDYMVKGIAYDTLVKDFLCKIVSKFK